MENFQEEKEGGCTEGESWIWVKVHLGETLALCH
jgi:hypothetical protein